MRILVQISMLSVLLGHLVHVRADELTLAAASALDVGVEPDVVEPEGDPRFDDHLVCTNVVCGDDQPLAPPPGCVGCTVR